MDFAILWFFSRGNGEISKKNNEGVLGEPTQNAGFLRPKVGPNHFGRSENHENREIRELGNY